MEHAQHLHRQFPWRRATLVASAVAAVELVALVGALLVLVAKPLARSVHHHAARTQAPAAASAPARPRAPAHALRPRRETSVLVLNGNGIAGAAGAEAGRLHSLGYRVGDARNAPRHDYAASMVMYRAGFAAEARRLARDAHVALVGPLDGIRPSQLTGSELVVILGSSGPGPA